MNNIVLYFSLNRKTEAAFCEFIEQKRFCFKDSFRLECPHAQHVSDLFYALNKIDGTCRVFVIIDYISFYYTKEDEVNKEVRNYKFDLPDYAAKQVRRAILMFPEFNFLFDESGLPKDFIFTSFLFPEINKREDLNTVFIAYHQFNNSNTEPFISIINGESNLFDGSNLRHVIKRYLYRDLKCSRYNFEVAQNSRRKHLAICVEEEYSQSRYNCYAAYVNGFRVLPVLSCHELQFINESVEKNLIQPEIIIRDYDLQFSDIYQDNTRDNTIKRAVTDSNTKLLNLIDKNKKYDEEEKVWKSSVNGIDYLSTNEKNWNEIIPINEIDRIRGAKHIDEKYIWYALTNDELSPYWNSLTNTAKVIFITKGVHKLELSLSSNCDYTIFKDGVSEQTLRGIYKPVTGLYKQLWDIPEIETVASNILKEETPYARNSYKKKFGDEEPPRDSGKCQVYRIVTKREGHDHGVPLDLYEMVKAMINRAEVAYYNKKYVRAAIIASESIEVMNGFHEDLMLRAYHIKAVSENALVMNVLGGDEKVLRKDTIIRATIIKNTIHRLLYAKEINMERVNLAYNVLNQIFSDCSILCKEKKHFLSEEVFIREMAVLNEGYTLHDIWVSLVDFFKK